MLDINVTLSYHYHTSLKCTICYPLTVHFLPLFGRQYFYKVLDFYVPIACLTLLLGILLVRFLCIFCDDAQMGWTFIEL